MLNENGDTEEKLFVNKAVEASIKIAVVAVLVVLCYSVISPFIGLMAWGIIIAVAAYPTYLKVEKRLNGRRGLSATIMTILMLLVVIVPVWLLAGTFISGISELAGKLQEGTLVIPPPPASVESWPLVGKKVAALWASAAANLDQTLMDHSIEIKAAGGWLLSGAAKMGLVVILLFASMIVGGVFLAYAEPSRRLAFRIARRLAGEKGEELVLGAGTTIRSVFRGILGVAFIQSVLAGVGLLAAGIPGAGLLAFVCLLLSVVQIGPLPILLPAIIYMWFTADTLPALAFTVWSIFVGVSDNILKPLLLGRGADAPMLVVLLGAIGGFIALGVIGLFVGAVILTLGHRLFMAWLSGNAPVRDERDSAAYRLAHPPTEDSAKG
jgi:predicted PurR-regulated permease PerM